MEFSTTFIWAAALIASILFDTMASAYLKVAGDRFEGTGFFLATLVGVVAFAPSIVLLGYALKIGPSYLASVGIWFIGAYAANAMLGIIAFDDPFSAKIVVGIASACVTILLLTP